MNVLLLLKGLPITLSGQPSVWRMEGVLTSSAAPLVRQGKQHRLEGVVTPDVTFSKFQDRENKNVHALIKGLNFTANTLLVRITRPRPLISAPQ